MARGFTVPRLGTPEREAFERQVVESYRDNPCALVSMASRFRVRRELIRQVLAKHDVALQHTPFSEHKGDTEYFVRSGRKGGNSTARSRRQRAEHKEEEQAPEKTPRKVGRQMPTPGSAKPARSPIDADEVARLCAAAGVTSASPVQLAPLGAQQRQR